MIQRLVALLLVGCFLISLSGCALFWGNEHGHKFADVIHQNKDRVDDGILMDNRHGLTHLEIILKDFREMHRVWDRYFMNYDWEDPYMD
ncbi:MAG: hypothetical protein ACYTG7_20580 [Planctomycetota bacterium]|jgi:hypothetical protein